MTPDKEQSAPRPWSLNRWLPWLVLGLFMALSLQAWYAAYSHDERQIRRQLRQTGESVAVTLETTVIRYASAIERFARQLSRQHSIEEQRWRIGARRLHQDYPLFQAIEWIDPAARIQWVVPEKGNESAIGFNVAFNQQRETALERIAESGRTDFTRVIELRQDGEGMVIYSPISAPDGFRGYTAGVFRLSQLVPGALDGSTVEQFSIRIGSEGRETVSFRSDPEGRVSQRLFETSLGPERLDWSLKLRPSYAWLETRRSAWAPWLIATLLLTGAMLALMLHLAQSVWRRNWALDETREALLEETERRATALADLDRTASTDALTGLANRRFFMEDMAHSIQRSRQKDQRAALIVLDLRGFQALNDAHGYRYGDQLLVAVAEQLNNLEDEQVLISRSSSDEFYIRYAPLDSLEPLFRLIERIGEIFSTPMAIEGDVRPVEASIGVALYPDHAADAETLLTGAETAMRNARMLNGTRYEFFSESLQEEARRRLALQRSLHEAFERNEFEVLYEPQKDLATGQIGSLEAKVRWRHPERGLLAPGEFLTTAMDSGLINTLGRRMVTAACEQLRQWRNTECGHLAISVNLSGPELEDPGFVQHIRSELQRCELIAAVLELELAENSLAAESRTRAQQLQALAELGTPIAIDDFGKGTASLAWLREFPVHQIKIDKVFVQRAAASHNDAVIVRALINLAHNLGIQVTATGVDTDAQLTFLRAHRCDFAQGGLVSPPLWPQQVVGLVSETSRG